MSERKEEDGELLEDIVGVNSKVVLDVGSHYEPVYLNVR